MSKGSKQQSTTTVPPELLEMIKQNYEKAKRVAEIGYVPYQGNTTAALTPQMMSGMRGADTAAQAFGMANAGGDLGVPEATADASGVMGYSPYAQYQQAISQIPAGQKAAIDSFSIDPNTGAGQGQGQVHTDGGGVDPTRTDDNYLIWAKNNAPQSMTYAQQIAAENMRRGYGDGGAQAHGYGSYGSYGRSGEVAETPGYGVVGTPGSLGRYGGALDSIGQAIGSAISGVTGESVGSNAGTTSPGGAGAAAAAGFGGGDFGGW